ncbi:MAG: DsbA family protein [Gemmatimonadota bacterium]
MKKPLLFLLIGLVVGLGAGYAIGSGTPDVGVTAVAAGQTADGTSASGVPVDPLFVKSPLAIPGRPARGPEDAAVTVVEFTDYECPFCRRYFHETLPGIRAEYGSRIRYVVRNLPLRSIHPQAQKAAEAAECAFDQGRFWAYHDALFQNAPKLGVADLKRYARDVGLDGPRFDGCLDSSAKADVVQADLRAGVLAGLQGTPSFFVNSQLLVGAQPLEVFRTFLDAALGDAPAP